MSVTESEHRPRIVVICGLSGAGKTTASDALEDAGYFCVDNLPVGLLADLVEFSHASGGQLKRLGLVTTVHEADEARALLWAVDRLRVTGCLAEILFLDAADEVLLRRYSETRRPHPFGQSGADLGAAIGREREILSELSGRANHVIDTSELRGPELKEQVLARVDRAPALAPVLSLMSFGFKHGVPSTANVVLDVRFLPNPYFVDELRPQTGEDPAVSQFVLEQLDAQTFLERVEGLFEAMVPLYTETGIGNVRVAIGCTGGRHRSVALSVELAQRLERRGLNTKVRHRDLSR